MISSIRTLCLIGVFISIIVDEYKAQTLQANAGPDTVFCAEPEGLFTAVIGGDPAATGGVPPYSYRWFGLLKDSVAHPHGMHAGHVLVDTTDANPEFMVYSPGWGGLTLYLEVTDSVGEISVDSVVVRVCGHTPEPTGYVETIYPEVGEIISITAGTTNWCDWERIEWFPKEIIVGPTNRIWADIRVDSNFFDNHPYAIFYTKDGCEAQMNFWEPVVGGIRPSGVTSVSEKSLKLFPNPVNKGQTPTLSSSDLIQDVSLLDLTGKTLARYQPNATQFQLPIELASGFYFVTTRIQGEVKTERLVVE